MRARFIVSFFATCLALGCGGTTAAPDTGTGPGNDAGNDAATQTDSGPPTADAGSDAGGPTDSGCNGVELTVMNYLAWCSVAVNGGGTSASATQTVCVPADTDIALAATANTGFALGDWHHTDGDTGTGDPGTVSGGTTSATFMTGASGAACVWICCPFVGGTGCPTTDQCP